MAAIRGSWIFAVHGRVQLIFQTIANLHASIRGACGLKWVLVVLTFEGAIRVGMLLNLFFMTWRQLMK